MKEMLFVSSVLQVLVKSTFFVAFNLLEEVTSGHITVNGYDLTEKQPMLTTSVKISEWCSNTSTSSHMSVLDNITFAPIGAQIDDQGRS